jgi:hypothetical protein
MDREAKPQVYVVQAKCHDSYKSLVMTKFKKISRFYATVFHTCNIKKLMLLQIYVAKMMFLI